MKHKVAMFKEHGLKKSQKAELKMVFLTTYGVKRNATFNSLNIAAELTIDDLLE
ncbi:MAG: hypothetical protein IE880_07315 [Epsilonproteobacteria bacterium]|nr:hypothetical protein [Campylobacterota bacterium]